MNADEPDSKKLKRVVDIRKLEQGALAIFADIPGFITIILHTTGDEISEVPCRLIGKEIVKIFMIPKQHPVFVDDLKYGHFVFVKVNEKGSEEEGWLVMQTQYGGTAGFLLPLDTFPYNE